MPQDFSHQNLRGRSFRGQNLEQANFCGADIRGADFTNALLIGANFRSVKAGLRQSWAIGLLIVSWLLSGILGLFSVSVGGIAAMVVYRNGTLSLNNGIIFLIMLPIFFIITIRKSLAAGLGAFAFGLAVYLGLSTVVGRLLEKLTIGRLLSAPLHLAISLAAVAVLAAIFAVAGGFAIAFAFAFAVAGTTGITVAFAIAFVLALVVGAIASSSLAELKETSITAAFTIAFILAFVLAFVFTLFSAYIGWRNLARDEKDAWIRSSAIAFAAIGGTSFRGANLTDANFTGAILKSTDFRGAIVIRTCWHKTKMLDRVRPGTTYLQNTQLRQVLVTGLGQDKNFDRQDLRGVNFQQVQLADASFIGADLSGANLQDADLSRAKLVQAQLDETDLTTATLTGACIEDWGITIHTKLDGVRCEYVYMRLPTKEDPNPRRKPDNWEEKFKDSDFADFIKPIVDTLDLYHNQGVDPRAIAISFKQLAENNPDAELRIVGMEVRGEDKFLLRAKTAFDADKSKLSAEYFSTYNQFKGLSEQEIRLLLLATNIRLEEKDSQIRKLEGMVNTALQPSNVYSKTHIQKVETMSNNPGSFSVGGSIGGNISNVQGDHNRTVQGDNNQGVIGDSNQVTQRNQVGADPETSLTKDDVVKLLAELETLIQKAELPTNTKEEVTEDLSATKKATDKEEPNKKRALERLTNVAETLEKASKTVDAGQSLWSKARPIIVKVAGWLGAAAGSHLLGL